MQDRLIDLTDGIALDALEEGRAVLGNIGGETVFILRTGTSVRVFSAICTHLGAPLQNGLLDGGTVICPWHHACFDLHSGKALTAPAFNPLRAYEVKISEGKVTVGKPMQTGQGRERPQVLVAKDVAPMVIVGGGAAGFAAADTLRERGWHGPVIMCSADADPPYDRTLLTKDYLDGHFGDDRLEIARGRLASSSLDLRLDTRVESIDRVSKTLHLADGGTLTYHKLLLATGSTPKRLQIPGADQANVLVLRSLADCRRLLAAARHAERVVVIGGSFIGLEAAASLKSRGLAVDVVVPQQHPMEKLLGRDLSDLIVETMTGKGVGFHLGRKPARIEGRRVILDDESVLQADAVLIGIGVTPNTRLATTAGLEVEDGVIVDALLQTSDPDILAAGDIANWPDRISGGRNRVEHWVVAERQGQVAAANMLGASEPFVEVPFFWSKFFDLSFRYVGHAKIWDKVTLEGDLQRRDAMLRYSKDGVDLAVATVGRDRDALLAERAFQLRSGPEG